MEKVLLHSFNGPLEADALIKALKKNNITATVEEENSTKVNVMGCDGVSGNVYSVYVNDYSLAKAQKVLKKLNLKQKEKITFWCPKCGEDKQLEKKIVHHKYAPTWQWILAAGCFVLTIIAFFITDGEMFFFPGGITLIAILTLFRRYDEELYHCKKCGHDFSRDD